MSYDTFDSVLTRTCEKFGDRTAIRFHDRSVTYHDLLDESRALAAALFELGVGRDDRVALMLSNRPEYVVANLAIPAAGGIWVPLNDMLGVGDLEYMLSDSHARFAVVGPNFADAIADLEAAVPSL